MNYDAANEFLKHRLNVATTLNSNGLSTALPPQVRAHCFFSARVAEDHILSRLREVSDSYSRGELSLAEARTRLKQFIAHADPSAPTDAEDSSISNLASTARLNLILRQNAAMANSVGQYQVGRDPDIEERWPYWRYIARDDARGSHAFYNGKIFKKSDPIWHRIFPPWEFNCRCMVEDAGDQEAEDAGGVSKESAPPPSESGYEFDPANAFGRFDLSRITSPDVRFKTVEGLELELGDKLKRSGLKLRVDSGKTYDTWEDKKLPPAKEWQDPHQLPTELPPEKASAELENRLRAVSADKSEIVFGKEIPEHWSLDGSTPKLESEIRKRLSLLNMAVMTVRKPHERWDQETQRIYISAFKKETGGFIGCLVAVSNDGKARTYTLKDINSLNKARKGISFEVFK